MEVIFKDIVYVAFVVVCFLVAHYAIPYLKKLTENEVIKEILDVIARAVKFAEQTIPGDKKGKEKFNAVQMYLSDLFKKKGIDIAEKDLKVMIESAVYAMNNEWGSIYSNCTFNNDFTEE